MILLLGVLLFTSTGICEIKASAMENEGQTEVKYLSNQELFDALENNGYKLEDIFTLKEIEEYKSEDQMRGSNVQFRAGKTQFIETGDDTSTLYLSSAYTKTIAALGSRGVGIIASLVSGPMSGAISGILGSIVSSNIDTSKGIYIKFKSQPDATGQYLLVAQEWGYQ